MSAAARALGEAADAYDETVYAIQIVTHRIKPCNFLAPRNQRGIREHERLVDRDARAGLGQASFWRRQTNHGSALKKYALNATHRRRRRADGDHEKIGRGASRLAVCRSDPPQLFTMQASARAINDEGVIIGEAIAPTSTDTGIGFGALWTEDHRPTSVDASVVAINASGRVLGVTGVSDSRRLVLIDY